MTRGARSRRGVRLQPDIADDLGATMLAAWRTNARVTAYLVAHLPGAIWSAAIPGDPRGRRA